VNRKCNFGCYGSREGSATATVPCNEFVCGVWAPWFQYIPCNAVCGTGVSVRKRACIARSGSTEDPTLCEGESVEYKTCVVGALNYWSTWSEDPCASGSCTKNGTQYRTCLGCVGGCPGPSQLFVDCTRSSNSANCTS
jgi:hypothetical protein